MKTTINPTPEQIAKLPKWAQEHIERTGRLLERCQSSIKKIGDEQTASPVYVDDWHSDPRVKRYIQICHNSVTVEHAGVKADIMLVRKDDSQRIYGIQIQYEAMVYDGKSFNPIAIVPRSMSTIQLVHKDYL